MVFHRSGSWKGSKFMIDISSFHNIAMMYQDMNHFISRAHSSWPTIGDLSGVMGCGLSDEPGRTTLDVKPAKPGVEITFAYLKMF